MEIILKLATSLDGKIALSNGISKWITNEQSRKNVHELRASCDAIITGIGTVLKDNPSLNARLENKIISPKRLVLDSNLRTPIDFNIVTQDTVFFTNNEISIEKENAFKAKNIEIIKSKETTPLNVYNYAQSKGYKRILIEAGGKIAASFLKAGLINKIYWYRAPIIIGGDGINVIDNIGLETLENIQKLKLLSSHMLDDNILEIYEIGK